MRDRDLHTLDRVEALNPAALSIVTVVELEGGVHQQPEHAGVRRRRLDEMLGALSILPFEAQGAAAYGRIVAQLGFSRRRVLDRMIAATALVHRATLVTASPDDFADVPTLRLLSW